MCCAMTLSLKKQPYTHVQKFYTNIGMILHSTSNIEIAHGCIIEAAISYYPIRNGWKFWNGKNALIYYRFIQDCRSYDLQNLGLKIHNFSLEASYWIVSTLVRRYIFFNPRFCKSWDCPNPKTGNLYICT